MAETKPIRLAAAAKKLNVGTGTIVDYLNNNGFEVENKPTTKLDPEMYESLLKEFRGQMDLKEEAEQITLGGHKRENIELDKSKAMPAKTKHDDETQEIMIKSNIVEEEEEKPQPEEVVKAKAEKLGGPKVVGKIDLVPKKVEPKEEEAPKEEAPKKEVEEKPKEAEPVEEKAEEVQEEKPEPVVEAKKEPAEDDNHIKTKKVNLEGPKILGKIDLKVNEKPKKEKPEPKPDNKAKDGAKEESNDEKRKRRRRRVVTNRQGQEGGGPGNRRRDDRRQDGKKKGDLEKPVVSEKEIEEKIKATMAKIAKASGKSQRSKLRRAKRQDVAETERKKQEEVQENVLELTEFVTVSELSNLMSTTSTEVIKTCMNLGVIVSINQRLDAEIIELVTDEFGFEVNFISVADEDVFEDDIEDAEDDLQERAPVVTIMGHVDHGKTTLLDYIKDSNVVAKEAGGITQHIGAYDVITESGKRIAFLDTPGHEAFTAMRARGAKLTDVAVIVIAADDKVMPQTKEAISHAQSAGVPMIFALNKMDKDGANPDVIKEQLSQMNILLEDWGGKFQSQEISAKKGSNVDLLLEKILLESELLELKANPDKRAIGTIVEASLDKGRGYVATLLVQNGTLKVGDMIVSGQYYGKVKAMTDHLGKRMKLAGPATPVQLLGLNGAPQAGEKFKVFTDEQEAKQIASRRGQIEREQGIRATKHITLDEIGRRLALGNFKELNVIVKGDVDGSVEALSDSLLKLSTDEIQVRIIHKGVGQITESDVLLASASDAIVIGFQVRPSLNARRLAENENIEIRLYSVIYKAIDEVKAAMEGMLEPDIEEKIVANVEIREVFKISKVGTIAGCYVSDGKIKRDHKVRIIRDGIVVYTGELASLKRFKDDVKEVQNGMECGLNIKDFNDIKVGDVVEAYEEVEVKRTL